MASIEQTSAGRGRCGRHCSRSRQVACTSNFLAGDVAEKHVRTAYGPNYKRLTDIKAKYDPANLFRLNHKIRPAGVRGHVPACRNTTSLTLWGANAIEHGCPIQPRKRNHSVDNAGLDLNTGMLEVARSVPWRAPAQMECREGNAVELPFEDGLPSI